MPINNSYLQQFLVKLQVSYSYTQFLLSRGNTSSREMSKGEAYPSSTLHMEKRKEDYSQPYYTHSAHMHMHTHVRAQTHTHNTTHLRDPDHITISVEQCMHRLCISFLYKRHACADASCIHSTYQEDDFENTSCNNSVIRICGLKSISHCDHFGVEDYSQEGQEDHLDDDHLCIWSRVLLCQDPW